MDELDEEVRRIISERARRAINARWARLDAEARKKATAPATRARKRIRRERRKLARALDKARENGAESHPAEGSGDGEQR